MLGRGIGFAISFAIPIILVRVFSQAEFGTYKQFFLVGGTLVSILDFGLVASLFYYIPKEPKRAGSYLRQTVIAMVLVGLTVSGALWAARTPVAGWLNSPALAALIPFLAAYITLEMIGKLLETVVVLEKQAKLAALVFAGSDATRSAALLVPAILTGDLRWVAAGAAGYALLRAVGLIIWALWRYRDRTEPGAAVYRGREQVAYSLPFGGAALLHHGLYSYHSFYVAASFNPALYAIYAVGCQQIAPISIFFRSIFEVTLVRMTEHAKAGRLQAMRELWRNLIARQAVLMIPLFVALWMLAEPFVVGVFTAQYREAVPIFRIYLLILPLTMLNDHAVLRATAHTRFIFMANALATAVALLMVPVLALQFQLAGAVTGFILGIATMKALGLWRIARLLDVPVITVLPWRPLGRSLLGGLAAAALVYPTLPLVEAPLAQFFGCGALFWIAYFGVAWIGNVFGPEEKAIITRLGHRLLLAVRG